MRLRVLIGLAALLLAFALDGPVMTGLEHVGFLEGWGELREGLTGAKFLGSGLGTFVIGLGVAAADRRHWRRGVAIWLVAVVTGFAGTTIKSLTGRPRPFVQAEQGRTETLAFAGPRAGLTDSGHRSFPSGHTIGAFSSATCLATFYPQARVVVYAVAAAAGVNRCVSRQHYPSDVVAAALLAHVIATWLLGADPLRRLWCRRDVDTFDPAA
jgi:undecaprenyl-diphosphatase